MISWSCRMVALVCFYGFTALVFRFRHLHAHSATSSANVETIGNTSKPMPLVQRMHLIFGSDASRQGGPNVRYASLVDAYPRLAAAVRKLSDGAVGPPVTSSETSKAAISPALDETLLAEADVWARAARFVIEANLRLEHVRDLQANAGRHVDAATYALDRLAEDLRPYIDVGRRGADPAGLLSPPSVVLKAARAHPAPLRAKPPVQTMTARVA